MGSTWPLGLSSPIELAAGRSKKRAVASFSLACSSACHSGENSANGQKAASSGTCLVVQQDRYRRCERVDVFE